MCRYYESESEVKLSKYYSTVQYSIVSLIVAFFIICLLDT